jgi:hypothetical protein
MNLDAFLTYLAHAQPTSGLADELVEILALRGERPHLDEHRLAS